MSLQLVARPLTDEFAIINYLHSRYKVLRIHRFLVSTLTLGRSILKTWPQI